MIQLYNINIHRWTGEGYVRQWAEASLAQAKARHRLFDVKTLPEPKLVYCLMDLRHPTQTKIWWHSNQIIRSFVRKIAVEYLDWTISATLSRHQDTMLCSKSWLCELRGSILILVVQYLNITVVTYIDPTPLFLSLPDLSVRMPL